MREGSAAGPLVSPNGYCIEGFLARFVLAGLQPSQERDRIRQCGLPVVRVRTGVVCVLEAQAAHVRCIQRGEWGKRQLELGRGEVIAAQLQPYRPPARVKRSSDARGKIASRRMLRPKVPHPERRAQMPHGLARATQHVVSSRNELRPELPGAQTRAVVLRDEG